MEITKELKEEKILTIKLSESSSKSCICCSDVITKNQKSYTTVCDCNNPIHHTCFHARIEIETEGLKPVRLENSKIVSSSIVRYKYEEQLHCSTCKKPFIYQPSLGFGAKGVTSLVIFQICAIFYSFAIYIIFGSGFTTILQSIVFVGLFYLSESDAYRQFILENIYELILIPLDDDKTK